MYTKNNGSGENNVIQNRFTACKFRAVSHICTEI